MVRYSHYKGGVYEVLHELAKHTEREEIFVVYRRLTEPDIVYVRPYDMFHGLTEDGIKRFERMT